MTTDQVTPDLAGELASLVDAPRYRPGPPCGVSVILTQLDAQQPAAAVVLRKNIDNDRIAAAAIAEKLTKAGLAVRSQAISRHRRRGLHNGCRCDK